LSQIEIIYFRDINYNLLKLLKMTTNNPQDTNPEENLNAEATNLKSDADVENSLDEMEQLVEDLETNQSEELEEEELTPLEVAENTAAEAKDNMLRLAAEMDNLRKRTVREVEQARKFAVERFAKEVLLIKDSLDMGMQASQAEGATVESIREGIEITMKQLASGLEKFNIKEIEAEGAAFNPEFHEAMAMQPSTEHEPNMVMFVMQKGFMINDRVLRPARVMVSKAPD
jgi:molecular chaperone GrpE